MFNKGDIVNVSKEYLKWYRENVQSWSMIKECELGGMVVTSVDPGNPESIIVTQGNIVCRVNVKFVTKA